jgi:RNA polymerase sigma-70 factor (ECF subfamily)
MPGRAPRPRLYLVDPVDRAQPLQSVSSGEPLESAELAAGSTGEDGDPGVGLAELYRAYAGYIAGLGIRLLGARDQAEDLVQDVFMEAVPVADRLRSPHQARRWLAVVAVRKARRRLRRQRIMRWLGRDDTPDHEELADPAMNPRDAALLAQLYRVLDRLPASQRIAWILRHVQGARLKEVAEMCGSSLATAKRHIAAAQRALEEATSDA